MRAAARLIADQQPVAVFSNEHHDDGVTRYLSACWLDSLSETLNFGAVAAESFSFESPVRRRTTQIDQIDGFYVRDPHFNDVIHVGGEINAYFLGYDFSRVEPGATDAELEDRGIAANRWNRRDRSGAIRLLESIQHLNVQDSIFVHVGPGHSQRHSIQRANGVERAIAGHFEDLLAERTISSQGTARNHTQVVSIDNALADSSDFRRELFYPCGEVVVFAYETIIVEYQADRIHCIQKADFRHDDRFHDVIVIDRPSAASNGFVMGLSTICGHRRAVEIAIPQDIALQSGQSLRLSIRQHDGAGRYVLSWVSPNVQPGDLQVTAYPFETGPANLVWELVSGGNRPTQSVETRQIDNARGTQY